MRTLIEQRFVSWLIRTGRAWAGGVWNHAVEDDTYVVPAGDGRVMKVRAGSRFLVHVPEKPER